MATVSPPPVVAALSVVIGDDDVGMDDVGSGGTLLARAEEQDQRLEFDADEVAPGLYVGSIRAAFNPDELSQRHIVRVLNVSGRPLRSSSHPSPLRSTNSTSSRVLDTPGTLLSPPLAPQSAGQSIPAAASALQSKPIGSSGRTFDNASRHSSNTTSGASASFVSSQSSQNVSRTSFAPLPPVASGSGMTPAIGNPTLLVEGTPGNSQSKQGDALTEEDGASHHRGRRISLGIPGFGQPGILTSFDIPEDQPVEEGGAGRHSQKTASFHSSAEDQKNTGDAGSGVVGSGFLDTPHVPLGDRRGSSGSLSCASQFPSWLSHPTTMTTNLHGDSVSTLPLPDGSTVEVLTLNVADRTEERIYRMFPKCSSFIANGAAPTPLGSAFPTSSSGLSSGSGRGGSGGGLPPMSVETTDIEHQSTSNPSSIVSSAGSPLQVSANAYEATLQQHNQQQSPSGSGTMANESGAAAGAVLICCHRGTSRSVSVAAAYLMDTMALSAEQALRQINDARPAAAPNMSFLSQLYVWERSGHVLETAEENYDTLSDEFLRLSHGPRIQTPLLSPKGNVAGGSSVSSLDVLTVHTLPSRQAAPPTQAAGGGNRIGSAGEQRRSSTSSAGSAGGSDARRLSEMSGTALSALSE